MDQKRCSSSLFLPYSTAYWTVEKFSGEVLLENGLMEGAELHHERINTHMMKRHKLSMELYLKTIRSFGLQTRRASSTTAPSCSWLPAWPWHSSCSISNWLASWGRRDKWKSSLSLGPDFVTGSARGHAPGHVNRVQVYSWSNLAYFTVVSASKIAHLNYTKFNCTKLQLVIKPNSFKQLLRQLSSLDLTQAADHTRLWLNYKVLQMIRATVNGGSAHLYQSRINHSSNEILVFGHGLFAFVYFPRSRPAKGLKQLQSGCGAATNWTNEKTNYNPNKQTGKVSDWISKYKTPKSRNCRG